MKDRGYIIRNETTGGYIICIPKNMRDPYPLRYNNTGSKTHNYAPVPDSSDAIQGLEYIREANAEKKDATTYSPEMERQLAYERLLDIVEGGQK